MGGAEFFFLDETMKIRGAGRGRVGWVEGENPRGERISSILRGGASIPARDDSVKASDFLV